MTVSSPVLGQKFMQALIASLLATTTGEMIAKFTNAPLQSGFNDCGLFAIAHAVTIAPGLCPEEC